jgi:hypothetical protein
MRHVVSIAFVVVAIIHLIPLVGVLGPGWLEKAYGVPVADANLELLLRHRAVLFGVVGGLLLVAAFHRPLQAVAWSAGFVGVVSFLALAWAVGPINAPLRRVAVVDVVALALLILAGAIDRLAGSGRPD